MRESTKLRLISFALTLLIFILGIITFFIMMSVFSSILKAAPPDDVAVDFAVATMIEGVDPAPSPSPYDCPTCKDTGWIMHGDGHQTKCPNCDLAGLPGGPFDIIRQAKELIRKGNELADRGKALLDAIQRDGKLTVDIRLPQIPSDCPDGECPVAAGVPEVPRVQFRGIPQELSCSGGECSSRTYTKKKVSSRWRWKR